MIQRRVEEHGIASAQRQLHVVCVKVIDELGLVKREVHLGEALRMGQQHGRATLDGHVAVRGRALQRERR